MTLSRAELVRLLSEANEMLDEMTVLLDRARRDALLAREEADNKGYDE